MNLGHRIQVSKINNSQWKKNLADCCFSECIRNLRTGILSQKRQSICASPFRQNGGYGGAFSRVNSVIYHHFRVGRIDCVWSR